MNVRGTVTKHRHNSIWIAGLLLGGCSGQTVQEKLQPTERALQPTVSAFECGGGSAKAAIASCRAEGAHYGHCAIVATRAGVSDATACYTYSAKIRKRREQLVGQEDQVDAQIRYLKDVNSDTQELNAELTGRLEEVTARTETARESLSQGEMSELELAQLRAILDIEVSSAQRQLDAASHELQAMEQYRSRQQAPTQAMDAEIARLEALLNETQRQTNALVAQRQRI